jgi:curli biogenesis system outer membrane secretion channel CsgG
MISIKKYILAFSCMASTILLAQDLPVVAVTEIKSSVDSGRYYDYKNTKSENFQNMLETQLVKLGRFKIMERNRVGEILGEQALQREFSNNNTNLSVKGVDYIVYGAITRFGSKKKEISTSGFASVNIFTEFGVDLKVVDATSGEVVRAENINVEMNTGEGVATDGFYSGGTKADPLSEIQRMAAKRVTSVIAESIFPIRVVTFRDESTDCCAYLNYGSAMFSVGDKVKAIRQEEEFIDPDTGINLGKSEETIGMLEIIETTQKFSKAKLLSGTQPKAKDLVRTTIETTGSSKNQRTKRGMEIQ